MGVTSSTPAQGGQETTASAPVPALPELLSELHDGVTTRDKRYYLRTYRNIVIGSEMVDWLADRPYCAGRAHAVKLGQTLVDAGFLHHVTHEHPFKDGEFFYRFRPMTEAGEPGAVLNAAERRAVEYDLVVIGGGAAGLTAASVAGKMGARVALVEKARLGGDCTWSGCVPSKSILAIAKQAHTARKLMEAGGGRGVSASGSVSVDMREVRAQIERVISTIYAEEDPAAIARKGVDVIVGEASFAPAVSGCDDCACIALDVRFRGGVDSIFPATSGGKADDEEEEEVEEEEGGESDDGGAEGESAHTKAAGKRKEASVEELTAATAAAAREAAAEMAKAAGEAVAADAGAKAGSMAVASLDVSPGDDDKPDRLVLAEGRIKGVGVDASDADVSASASSSASSSSSSFSSAAAAAAAPGSASTPARRITASNVVIATGAAPLLPDIEGLSSVPFFTYESVWANERLPEHLVVVGAGPIGCELAQAYRYLGAKVTLVGSGLLAKEEEAAREVMARVFERDGLEFVQGRPTRVSRHHTASGGDGDDTSSHTIVMEVAGREITCDMLLVSTGRLPHSSSLRLKHAGVSVGKRGGVVVDEKLQTSRARVFAAGDVIEGNEQFTHLAGKQGYVAARNALFWGMASGEPAVLPRCTFTSPEIASVGLTEEQALSKYGDSVWVHRKQNSAIDRTLADGETDGYVSVAVLRETGKIVGATSVGPRAGEIIAEAAVAMTHGLKASDIALTVHPYPVHAFGFQQVCSEVASTLFRKSTVGGLIQGFYKNARKHRAD